MIKKDDLKKFLKDKGKAMAKLYETPSMVTGLSSGVYALDSFIGTIKGFPRGMLSELYGPEGSGKTTLAMHTAKMCQTKLNKTVIWMDYERSFNADYFKNMGIDVNEPALIYMCPATLEEGSQALKQLLSQPEIGPEIGLIVIDSVAAMTPEAVYEVNGKDSIGQQARGLANMLSWLVKDVRTHDIVCLVLNQERTDINKAMSFANRDPDPTQSTGGKALKFYVSLKYHLKPMKGQDYVEKEKVVNESTGKTEDRLCAHTVRITNVKTRMTKPGGSIDVLLRYGQGFDNFNSIINYAIVKGKIVGGGAWYTYNSSSKGELRYNGKAKLFDAFKENNKELFLELLQWYNNQEDYTFDDDDSMVEVDEASEDVTI